MYDPTPTHIAPAATPAQPRGPDPFKVQIDPLIRSMGTPQQWQAIMQQQAELDQLKAMQMLRHIIDPGSMRQMANIMSDPMISYMRRAASDKLGLSQTTGEVYEDFDARYQAEEEQRVLEEARAQRTREMASSPGAQALIDYFRGGKVY